MGLESTNVRVYDKPGHSPDASRRHAKLATVLALLVMLAVIAYVVVGIAVQRM
jgi:hypothetical protein